MAVSAAQFLQMTRNFFVKFSWSFNENFCLSTKLVFGIDSQILRHKLESFHRDEGPLFETRTGIWIWALVNIQNLLQILHETSSMLNTDVLDSTLQIFSTFGNLINTTLFLVLLRQLLKILSMDFVLEMLRSYNLNRQSFSWRLILHIRTLAQIPMTITITSEPTFQATWSHWKVHGGWEWK